MDKKNDLSLCIITKDNENYLSNSLQNMKEFTNEIIIVDIGSKDSTIDIARQQGANVYQIEWRNSYSEVKNFCLDKAKGRWVLFLNGNEIISKDQLKALHHLLDNPNVEGYLLHIDYPLQKYHIFSPVQSLRLIRNRKEYRYQYKVFEMIPDELLNNIKAVSIRIVQQGNYSLPSEVELLKLLEEDLKEHSDDSYLQYMYGVELLNQQRYKESIIYFENAYKNINYNYLFAPHLYKCLSWALMFIKKNKEALNILDEGIKTFPFYTDLLVLRGELYKQSHQYEDAIKDLDKGLKIRKHINSIVPRPEVNSSIILETLGDIHVEIFNYKQSLEYYKQSYKLNNKNKKLLYKIEKLNDKSNPSQVIENILEEVVKQDELNDLIMIMNRFFQQKNLKVKEENIENPIDGGCRESDEKVINLEEIQNLGVLKYVLYSRGLIKKLEKWIEIIHSSSTISVIPKTPSVKISTKPSKALIGFYNSLGIDKNSINKNNCDIKDKDITCAKIHGEIGMFYEEGNKRRESLSSYLRVLQWDPLDELAQEKLRAIFNKDSSEFCSFLEKRSWILEGILFYNKQDFINYILGVIYFKNQELGKALEYFLKVWNNETSYSIALAYIVSSLWLEGNEKEAELWLKEKITTSDVFPLFLDICKIYVLDRLDEGQQKYPYSELIILEKQRLAKKNY